MPYISVSLSKDLSADEKESLKKRLGEIINLIPGKSEEVTMIDISDGHSLYLGGKALENGAFVEVRLWGEAEKKGKEALTSAVFDSLNELIGTPKSEAYLTIQEFSNWGYGGNLL